MANADGYTCGSYMSAATSTGGRYDIFKLNDQGMPSRHVGTFTAGKRDAKQAEADIIAIVNGLGALHQ